MVDLSHKRKSWKKIRNNLDKVKIISRHEAEVRKASITGSPELRRYVCMQRACPKWMVGWISDHLVGL